VYVVFLLLTFFTVAGSVTVLLFVVSDLVERDRKLAARRVQELRRPTAGGDMPALFKDVNEFDLGELARPETLPSVPTLLLGLRKRDWLRPLRDSLKRSALPVSPWQVLAGSATLAMGLALAGWWLQGLLLAVPGFLAGAAGPIVYVVARARAHRERFLAQLGGAFELMARVLRSGQSVPQAFQAVGDAFEDPIAGAFTRCREQQDMGLPPDVAFQELAEQSGVLEMRIFVMAMLIQRQVGGNLSEVLERLATLVRERQRIRGQVRTLTAEGRMQAAVLLVLPLVLFVAMRFVNRAYADELLARPGLLLATFLSMGVGALWIRKIVNFDI
jgi:tight adherence protein B